MKTTLLDQLADAYRTKHMTEIAEPATEVTLDYSDEEGVKPRRSVDNVCRVLEMDPRFVGQIQWCEFRHRIVYQGAELQDVHEAQLSRFVGVTYGLHVPSGKCREAIAIVADANRIHPVREYLEGLAWDGEERLATWLHRFMGCTDDSLSSEYGVRALIGAVARIMRPGAKVDTMLVFAGGQGARKSSAIRALTGPQWFAELSLDPHSKDSYQALDGNWIVEWGELDNIRRAEATAIKAFISKREDNYRPAYGRNNIRRPRQVVFIGTTNDVSGFLNDPTGSRRFWVREVVSPADTDGVAAARDQLWAEALVLFRKRERWWLDTSAEKLRVVDSVRWQHQDPWVEPILDWLVKQGGAGVEISDLLSGAVGKEPSHQTRTDSMRAATILGCLGWRKDRKMVNGRRAVRWKKAP